MSVQTVALSASFHRRSPIAAFAALLAMGALLAACASGPSWPLYSPIAATGSFGYSEQQLSADSYRVTYVAPVRSSPDSRNVVDDRRDAALTLSNDMAIWRAAEMALTNGHKEFRVVQRTNDVDIDRQYYERFRPSPVGYRRFGAPYPYHYGPPWRDPYDVYIYLRARTSLTVEFGRKAGQDFFIADEAIARLRQTYPTAAPMVGPVGPPTAPTPAPNPAPSSNTGTIQWK